MCRKLFKKLITIIDRKAINQNHNGSLQYLKKKNFQKLSKKEVQVQAIVIEASDFQVIRLYFPMTKPTDTNDTEFDIDNIEKHTQEQIDEFVKENFWRIRPCIDYSTEYDECSSIKGKFHQYFIHGDFLDCSSWKNNYRNCLKCFNDDNKACAYVICAEEKRKRERLKAHLANDTWKKRKSPPPDWNKPLPQWVVEKTQDAYLNPLEKQSCSIQ